MQTAKKTTNDICRIKPVKVFTLAAALAALLSLSVFAAYVLIPTQLERQFDTRFDNIRTVVDDGSVSADTVNVPQKSVRSGDYIVTFESVADSEKLRTAYEGTAEHTNISVSKKDTYALFSIRRSDGTPVDITGDELSFTVCLKGYAPNIAFGSGHVACKENGVVWYAAQVTDAKVFGGEELYIALHECNTADWEYFRMDENGNYFFTDRYQGIQAVFSLPLENDGLDPRTKEQFMADRNIFITDPDYSRYDAKAAKDDAFKASGIDLTQYIGSHEWLGSNPLQFGKVDMADEYISHRDDWKNGDIKTLSYEEVDAIANAAVALVNEKYDLQTVCSENEALFEQYIENAEFKDEFFPSDASYFTLSDGSKAYYLPCNAFIHHRNDGSASLVTAPCAGVVVEVNGINPLLNASNYYTGTTNHNGDVHSLTSPCVVAGRYLDGLGFDPDYPTYVGGSMEDFRYGYAELLKEITCREDAVYVIASEFWGYTGTVEVLI